MQSPSHLNVHLDLPGCVDVLRLNNTIRGILMQLFLMLRVVQGLEWFFAITRVRLLPL